MGHAVTATVLTIGHSTHSLERFVALLQSAGITAIADVRSSPYSRLCPHFNRHELRHELRRFGVSYVFLGNELGGRPNDPSLYGEGVADYEKMAATPEFRKGLDRVAVGARKYRIALMCSERDPLDCHRCLLIGRALSNRGIPVGHVLSNGPIVTQAEIEETILKLSGQLNDDFFVPRAERLAAAYRHRARKVAFAEPHAGPDGPIAAE